MWSTEEELVNHLCGFLLTTGKHQVAYFLQVFTGSSIVVVMRLSAPKGLLVQRECFYIRITKNHDTHLRVAYG